MRLLVLVIALMLLPLQASAIPSLDGGFPVGEDWPLPATIEPGARGPWVAELQAALNRAGFRAGDPDGTYGEATLAAVYAFQKLYDLERDGVFRTDDWPLLDREIPLPGDAPEPTRVEVDLGKQILYLIEDDRVELVLPISSANGETYVHSSGSIVRAVTPEGGYEFYKKVEGWRISYLGGLYRPFYFSGGYAIHGSGSVPPYPASHGCIRVEMWDMDYLAAELELGMPIYVYGTRNDRSDIVPETQPSAAEIAAAWFASHPGAISPR